MCTVTIIPTFRKTDPGAGQLREQHYFRGWRLACNRDERRTRTLSLPPRVVMVGEHRAMMPIDPDSGGTWIAINDAGMAATLLNVNAMRQRSADTWVGDPEDSSTLGLLSRGTIIPSLMRCNDMAAAEKMVQRLAARQYPPFRLLVLDGKRLLVAASDGQVVVVTQTQMGDEPVMFTSSGLGDALVEPPRRGLFRQMFATDADKWPLQQEAFHRHRFPGQPHLSVNMSRADARTVSLTVIEREGDRITMTHHADAPDAPTPPTVLALQLAAEALQ